MGIPTVDSAVARFCRAATAGSVDDMLATLTPKAELVSPVSGHVIFSGDDLRIPLGAVFGSLSAIQWRRTHVDGDVAFALADARVSGLRITDALVFDLDANGRIQRLTPHLRPWLGLTVLAVIVMAKLLRHPGVAFRSLRRSAARQSGSTE